VAPTHTLIIPKNKDGLTGVSKAEERHEAILGKLLVAAAKIAKQEGLEKGYNIVINDGGYAGQTVFYMHKPQPPINFQDFLCKILLF
jgi:diadenosine tetraphosphate (Ap4A) HIT family hydrolase